MLIGVRLQQAMRSCDARASELRLDCIARIVRPVHTYAYVAKLGLKLVYIPCA